jgi:hypothetical protein
MHRIRGRSLEYPYKRSKCHEREKSIHDVFNTGTRGFAAPEDFTTAVCILPRTELAFSEEVKCVPFRLSCKAKTINFSTAIFRQINKDVPRVHVVQARGSGMRWVFDLPETAAQLPGLHRHVGINDPPLGCFLSWRLRLCRKLKRAVLSKGAVAQNPAQHLRAGR